MAIIQARMSSTRLPGKSLSLLAGKPVVWHVFHRLSRCRTIDEVVLATSTDASDDELADYARSEGVHVVRGPLDNVLERYLLAVAETEPDLVVRVTGDAPLVDPETIDLLVDHLVEQGADYATLDPEYQTIHSGFEPFTVAALRRVAQMGGDDPASIEHVTPMMKSGSDQFVVAYLPSDESVRIDGARVSVDTPADLSFLESVYSSLGADPGDADVRDVVSLLRAKPSLMDINAHVHQKSAQERTHRALFVCDGGRAYGMGHLRRCMTLAGELVERHALGVRFTLTGDEEAAELIRRAGFGVSLRAEENADAWVQQAANQEGPDVVILDTRQPVSRSALAALRGAGMRVVVLDDSSDRRLEADLAFLPPVPQAERLSWEGAAGEHRIGWEWVVLGGEFGHASKQQARRDTGILVTMGGSDPRQLTLPVVKELAAAELDASMSVVVGPAFPNRRALAVDIRSISPSIAVVDDPGDMADFMRASKIGVCTFGVTAYEMAACGAVGVHVCLSDDDAESSSAFVEAGIALSLDVEGGRDLADLKIGATVAGAFRDGERLRMMSRSAARLVDGGGSERVAKAIAELAEQGCGSSSVSGLA